MLKMINLEDTLYIAMILSFMIIGVLYIAVSIHCMIDEYERREPNPKYIPVCATSTAINIDKEIYSQKLYHRSLSPSKEDCNV